MKQSQSYVQSDQSESLTRRLIRIGGQMDQLHWLTNRICFICVEYASFLTLCFVGCDCNGNSDSCVYNSTLSSAVCEECGDNSYGIHCELCYSGYYSDNAEDENTVCKGMYIFWHFWNIYWIVFQITWVRYVVAIIFFLMPSTVRLMLIGNISSLSILYTCSYSLKFQDIGSKSPINRSNDLLWLLVNLFFITKIRYW